MLIHLIPLAIKFLNLILIWRYIVKIFSFAHFLRSRCETDRLNSDLRIELTHSMRLCLFNTVGPLGSGCCAVTCLVGCCAWWCGFDCAGWRQRVGKYGHMMKEWMNEWKCVSMRYIRRKRRIKEIIIFNDYAMDFNI